MEDHQEAHRKSLVELQTEAQQLVSHQFSLERKGVLLADVYKINYLEQILTVSRSKICILTVSWVFEVLKWSLEFILGVKCVHEFNAHPSVFWGAFQQFWSVWDVFGRFRTAWKYPPRFFWIFWKISIFKFFSRRKTDLHRKKSFGFWGDLILTVFYHNMIWRRLFRNITRGGLWFKVVPVVPQKSVGNIFGL